MTRLSEKKSLENHKEMFQIKPEPVKAYKETLYECYVRLCASFRLTFMEGNEIEKDEAQRLYKGLECENLVTKTSKA